jgi:hypothetical protein
LASRNDDNNGHSGDHNQNRDEWLNETDESTGHDD